MGQPSKPSGLASEYTGPLVGSYLDDLAKLAAAEQAQGEDVYQRAAREIGLEFGRRHPPCEVCGRPATMVMAPPDESYVFRDALSIRYATVYSCKHVRAGE